MKKKTVLLIDDSTTNNLIFSDVLFEHNIQSIMAIDGFQALEMLKGNHPDLILLDMNMPKMNGIEFLVEMGKMGIQIPVMMMSGSQNQKMIRKAKTMGVKEYFAKPVDVRKFLRKVKQYLEIQN